MAEETRGYRIHGRVQGVAFRAFVRREARRLGVAGWTRNAPDGTVEVEATAAPDVLAAFEERLRQGPPAARVARLERRPSSGGPFSGDFSIAY